MATTTANTITTTTSQEWRDKLVDRLHRMIAKRPKPQSYGVGDERWFDLTVLDDTQGKHDTVFTVREDGCHPYVAALIDHYEQPIAWLAARDALRRLHFAFYGATAARAVARCAPT